jgi:hypothetical protein
MTDLAIRPNNSTPGVFFDKTTGELLIVGDSFPEDPNSFFNPIYSWIDNYLKEPSETTVLDIILTYYNSISASYLLKMMFKIEELHESGYKAKIRWFYNSGDVDLKSAGEEFQSLLDLDFNLILIGEGTEESEDVNNHYKLIDSLV